MKINHEILEVIKSYVKDLEPKQSFNDNIYFAISNPDGYLVTIGRNKEAFKEHKSLLRYTKIYKTTPLNFLLYCQKQNNNITELPDLIKLTIIIVAQLTNTNYLNQLYSLGITPQDYNDLIERKVNQVSGRYQTYSRKQLYETFNINELLINDYYLLQNLIKQISYEDIEDVLI